MRERKVSKRSEKSIETPLKTIIATQRSTYLQEETQRGGYAKLELTSCRQGTSAEDQRQGSSWQGRCLGG